MEDAEMRRVAIWFVIVSVLLSFVTPFAISAGSRALAKSGAEGLLKPQEAFALIQKNRDNPDFVVLDVRTPDEFKSGHIEGALNIDYNSGGFKTELAELDKKKTYFVYCRTGRRSGEAVRIMKDLGFSNIVRMEGDILKWQAANLPLVK
jgi:rhodanese-related sulfurtransferase